MRQERIIHRLHMRLAQAAYGILRHSPMSRAGCMQMSFTCTKKNRRIWSSRGQQPELARTTTGAHTGSNRGSHGEQPGLTRGATGAHTGNNRSSHGEATGQAVKVGPRTSLRKGEAVSRPWTYTAIGALHGAIQSTPEHYPEMARSKAWRCSLFLSKELELLLVY